MKRIDRLLLKAQELARSTELQLLTVLYGWDSDSGCYKILLDFTGGSSYQIQRKEITCSTEEEMEQRVQAELAAHPSTGKDRKGGGTVLFNVGDLAWGG